MKKLFTLLFLLSVTFSLKAQTQAYGVVDTADLKLSSCEFEKDANAMVLFNTCMAHYDYGSLLLEHHIRLKIFNSSAYDLGNINIDFPSNNEIESIHDLRAETINLNHGKVEIIPLNKKDIYKRKLDKWRSQYSFSFPSIKDGSILDYSYTQWISYTNIIPEWYFQDKLPVKFSEIKVIPLSGRAFTSHLHVKQELVENADTIVAMANIHSLPEEPFMDSYINNLQSVSFSFVTSYGTDKKPNNIKNTWTDIGSALIFTKGYGQQLKIKLKGEDLIIEQAKGLSPEGKIAFLFKKVKDLMSCYDSDNLFTQEPIYDAWLRKKGSPSEINLILCRLLTQSGLVTSPLGVSTDSDSRIDANDVETRNFDRTVAYVSVSGKNYVLDASEKDNKWYQIPFALLNTYGLYMNVETPSTGLILIEDNVPAKDIVYVNAEIMPEGKMIGTTQISSFSYNKIDKLLQYDKLGEKKYAELLYSENHDLKVDSIRFQNTEKDTIPFIQNIAFKLNLSASDENYIYFNPNLFTLLQQNPFLSENRYSDINFTYRRYYVISGRYKIPVGYKLNAIPKTVNLLMPDKSISFKRIAAEDDGYIQIHYVIKFDKSLFPKEEYSGLREFYKRMHEMLNEQIVLKKQYH
ncbi:DUF3857 domain-containing protein [Mucilaginibacter sp. McL0603]|uniref:DUF3857 domain-containing protein n=1 Tax=Mucilaginibacter sp. McL0603 TaxID=3415670 RepID=UPI003CFA7EF7